MHHIYKTEAFVLKTTPTKGADKFIVLLTKDLGLIKAVAQGLRYEKSKLRFALQDYSKAVVFLVRGKNDIWRITNALPEKNLFFSISNGNIKMGDERFKIVFRIFSLLERLVAGEETDSKLFEIVERGINCLESCNENSLLDIESIIVLRILNRLGYIGDNKNLNFYISDNKWENSLIEKMNSERKNALKFINEAIKQSQL